MVGYLRDRGEYSHREFAKKAGFASHSYVNYVIQGKRNLSIEAAHQIADALELNDEEETYFVSMVRLTETSDPQEKEFLFLKMQKSVKSRLIRKEIFDQFEFYEDWANVALYEAIPFEWSSIDLDELAKGLEVDRDRVDTALALLQRMDLVQQDDQLRWKRKNWAIETPDSTQSVLVRRFHHAMGSKALDALDDVPVEEREYGAMTLSLSKKNFEKFRAHLRKIRSELNALFSEEREGEALYQLNIQLFPLIRSLKDIQKD